MPQNSRFKEIVYFLCSLALGFGIVAGIAAVCMSNSAIEVHLHDSHFTETAGGVLNLLSFSLVLFFTIFINELRYGMRRIKPIAILVFCAISVDVCGYGIGKLLATMMTAPVGNIMPVIVGLTLFINMVPAVILLRMAWMKAHNNW